MSDSLQSLVQQVIAGRPRTDAPTPPAGAPPGAFQNWQFSGSGSNLFVQVSIAPGSPDGAIQSAMVILQTMQGVKLCDAAINTTNAQAGWTLNISAETATYDSSNGNQVQGWAFATVLIGGQLFEEHSPTKTFTIVN